MFKPYSVAKLKDDWTLNKRWQGIERPYTAEDVVRLRGTVQIEHTLARLGSERLWRLMHEEDYVHSLGAMTGNQAVQMVQAGLKAIYLSGWQVAADANGASQTYPDQSLYPADSAPNLVKRINNALGIIKFKEYRIRCTGVYTTMFRRVEHAVGMNLSGCKSQFCHR